MLDCLRNSHKQFVPFVGVVLLVLLVLKTGGVLFSMYPEKHRIEIDMSTDAEDTETEESIDTDKMMYFLLTDAHAMISLSAQDKAPMFNYYRCYYITDHFETIPSPPPDHGVI